MSDTIAAPAGGAFLLGRTDPQQVQTPEDFDEDLRLMASSARQFVEREYPPVAEQTEALDYEQSRRLLARAGALALLALDVPEEYGGLAQSKTASILVTEQLAQTGAGN